MRSAEEGEEVLWVRSVDYSMRRRDARGDIVRREAKGTRGTRKD